LSARIIDWTAIHRRLAATAAVLSGSSEDDPEQVRRILEARARAAAAPAAVPDGAEHLEVLGFSLGAETYGVEIRHVREVCQLKALTVVPCTPPFVAGVMNLHGRIIAIIDLRKLFDLPARGLTELSQVIVLAGGDDALGLLADSVDGVRPVPTAALQEGLPTLTGIRGTFLRGITGELLAILDGGRLLRDAALKVNECVVR
jgi:purine-binding chemotaxis protein CheW